jgi:hypothetical protein
MLFPSQKRVITAEFGQKYLEDEDYEVIVEGYNVVRTKIIRK